MLHIVLTLSSISNGTIVPVLAVSRPAVALPLHDLGDLVVVAQLLEHPRIVLVEDGVDASRYVQRHARREPRGARAERELPQPLLHGPDVAPVQEEIPRLLHVALLLEVAVVPSRFLVLDHLALEPVGRACARGGRETKKFSGEGGVVPQ
jgi:hypothetical protein